MNTERAEARKESDKDRTCQSKTSSTKADESIYFPENWNSCFLIFPVINGHCERIRSTWRFMKTWCYFQENLNSVFFFFFFLLLNPIFHIFVMNRPEIKCLMKTEFQFPENLEFCRVFFFFFFFFVHVCVLFCFCFYLFLLLNMSYIFSVKNGHE